VPRAADNSVVYAPESGFDGSVIFETDRTIVRLWRDDEADRVYDMLGRMEVAKWLGSVPEPMQSRDEAVQRIAAWRARGEEQPGLGTWAVEVKATGVAAGSVLLARLPNSDGEVEIGWHFHPDSWGHGYAREAAGALLDKAFTDGLPEVWAMTHLDNEPSQKVCRAIGLIDQGVFQDRWYEGESRIFRLTRAEWEPTRA
jgi:RimJ/RimL family protein N-acetyltransferase